MKKLHEFDQVLDSQKMFRIILEAMANPGRMIDMAELGEKVSGEYKNLIALGMTLLDNEVTCCCCGNSQMESELSELTLCGSASVKSADIILTQSLEQMCDAVPQAKGGTAEDPHKSALLVMQTGKHDENEKAVLRLTGPGIKGKLTIKVNREVEKILDLRDECGFEFPQGLDFIFIDHKSHICAIPRMVKKEAD